MDSLETIIEELIRERDSLLDKKQCNLDKIEEYNDKIAYFTYLYQQDLSLVEYRGMQIESYSNVLNSMEHYSSEDDF